MTTSILGMRRNIGRVSTKYRQDFPLFLWGERRCAVPLHLSGTTWIVDAEWYYPTDNEHAEGESVGRSAGTPRFGKGGHAEIAPVAAHSPVAVSTTSLRQVASIKTAANQSFSQRQAVAGAQLWAAAVSAHRHLFSIRPYQRPLLSGLRYSRWCASMSREASAGRPFKTSLKTLSPSGLTERHGLDLRSGRADRLRVCSPKASNRSPSGRISISTPYPTAPRRGHESATFRGVSCRQQNPMG